MRIAITGAHRTGKTSLAESLSEILPDHELREEPYRELEADGYEFADMPVAEDFLRMLDYSIEQLDNAGENVIFDRSPLDQLAYLEALSDEGVREHYNMVKEAMSEIDLLVYVPVETKDVIGCPENEQPELRLNVDEILRDWIREYNNVIKVSGTLQQRTDQVIRHMQSKSNKV